MKRPRFASDAGVSAKAVGRQGHHGGHEPPVVIGRPRWPTQARGVADPPGQSAKRKARSSNVQDDGEGLANLGAVREVIIEVELCDPFVALALDMLIKINLKGALEAA